MWCAGPAPLALVGGVTEWLARLSGQLNRAASGVSDPAALVFVFLAGVVASLTPCVYPVIPLVVAYMSGSEASALAGGAELRIAFDEQCKYAEGAGILGDNLRRILEVYSLKP